MPGTVVASDKPSAKKLASLKLPINQKHFTNIATLNVQSTLSTWRLGELAAACEAKKISAIAVQEHRLKTDQPFEELDVGSGWKFIFTSSDNGQGGVGFLMCQIMYLSLVDIVPINGRMLKVNIKAKNIASTLFSIYSPTSCSDLEIATEFYDCLTNEIQKVPIGNMLLVLGDFNATLTSDFLPPSTPNRNSELLETLLGECTLVPANTKFRKAPRRFYTFYGPNNRKAALDHCLLRYKWMTCLKNCEAFRLSNFKSDHNVVIASIRMRFNAVPLKRAPPRPDFSRIVMDGSADQMVWHTLLESDLPEFESDWKYESIVKTIQSCAGKVPTMTKKVKKLTIWKQPPISMIREANGSLENLNDAWNTELEKVARAACAEIDEAHITERSRVAWKLIKEFSGKPQKNHEIEGSSPDDILDKWAKYNEQLFRVPEEDADPDIPEYESMLPDSVQISSTPWTEEEIIKARNQLKFNKALDAEGLCAEAIQDSTLLPYLLRIMNDALAGDTPETWRISDLLMFFKKGDDKIPTNYRGIAIMRILSKLFLKLIANRIIDPIDPHLRNSQNGFRKERSTQQHILLLRRLIEESENFQDATLVLSFIDFIKAFDKIKWNQLWAILRAYRVPEILITAIQSVYFGSGASVKNSHGRSDQFYFGAGVKQGCVLAPFLFIICVDFVMRKAITDNSLGVLTKSTSVRNGGKTYCTDAIFADDSCLTSNTIENAQILLHSVEDWASQVGLKFNLTKTEVMLINCQGVLTSRSGTMYKQCEDFKYLGSFIRSSEKDMNSRIGQSWCSFNKLSKVWKSGISKAVKISTFRSIVESVLLYGAETWTLTKSMEHKLDGAYTRLLRAAQDIHWQSHTTNAVLYGSLPRISDTLRKRRLEFFGHNVRCDGPVSTAMFYDPNIVNRSWKRKVGKSKLTYIDTILNDTRRVRSELDSLKQLAKDRVKWKDLILNLLAIS